MIIYTATKTEFVADIENNTIEEKVVAYYSRFIKKSPSPSELASWMNSLPYMRTILSDPRLPEDAGVFIEYKIPACRNRVDFIVTGYNQAREPVAIMIELKQWTEVEVTEKDAYVKTVLGRGMRETQHPSYQASSYRQLLWDFSKVAQDMNLKIYPCAYLHNCRARQAIMDTRYQTYLDEAPVFLRDDSDTLKDFIAKHISRGDNGDILHKVDSGKLRPSKQLADKISSMMQGNPEFTLIDEQKDAYETALLLAKRSRNTNKQVLIVEGGPGTGKSVVAISLLAELINRQKTTKYVTRNSAPRTIYQQKLTGTFTKTRLSQLFTGSGSFTETEKNTFDVLIVDESHRLNEKSGMFKNQGENQIKELINSALLTIFFIDEDQQVTWHDIGSKQQIHHWAKLAKATVTDLELPSQFRCSGSNGYLNWLDHVLQIRDTANINTSELDYKITVEDSASSLKANILKHGNSSRLLAGYCWDWKSKKDKNAQEDIIIDDFAMYWNMDSYGMEWIVHPDGINAVGCIHTSQGLELENAGVIIGPDLIVRNGEVITDATKRSNQDQSIKGFKKMLKQNESEALAKADRIIKNTYKTLLSRASKRTSIYSVDPETNQYFRSRVNEDMELKG